MSIGFAGSNLVGLFLLITVSATAVAENAAQEVVVGDRSVGCAEDPDCMNRFHPDIPMIAEAEPGQRIVFNSRDAFDLTLDPDVFSSAKTNPRQGVGIVHALTGPVSIKGAKVGEKNWNETEASLFAVC